MRVIAPAACQKYSNAGSQTPSKVSKEAKWLDRFLFQILNDASPEEIAVTVKQSVSIFMAAYGPETSMLKKKTDASD